jgi:hypothetical protein
MTMTCMSFFAQGSETHKTTSSGRVDASSLNAWYMWFAKAGMSIRCFAALKVRIKTSTVGGAAMSATGPCGEEEGEGTRNCV